MEDIGLISRQDPDLKSQDFAFLREEGVKTLQAIAAATWSDHNIHDPGITLLEALCYAITEIGLQAGMEVKDLIASDVSGSKQPLFTAAEILPSAALTLNDFRKILIDHPDVRNAWLFPLSSEPQGFYSVLLEFENEEYNSNTFSITVNPSFLSQEFKVDVAFPYWDEEDVKPFYEEGTILGIGFEGIPGNEWKPIAGSDAYFARIIVNYQPIVGGPVATSLWLVSQVTTPMNNPVSDLPKIFEALNAELVAIGAGTVLELYRKRVIDVNNSIRVIKRYFKDYRNLCESFLRFRAVRIQEIAVSANIDINPGVILEKLLADIYFKIDQFIAPDTIFESLENMKNSFSSDQIFEGPLLSSGYLTESSLGDPELADSLYTSDILRLILQLRDDTEEDVIQQEDISERNIISVRNLSLSNHMDNRSINTEARDCLNLVKSQRHIPKLSLSKSRIVFFKNGIEVSYDINQVIEIFNEKKSDLLLQRIAQSSDIPLPTGKQYNIDTYYPVQNDLPLTYGVGEAGLPEYVSDERKAQALQLKGYLLHFEQLIAGMGSQLVNLNALFSLDPRVQNTIFQSPLYHLPMMEKLLKDFNASSQSWEDFMSDPNNGYLQTLQQSSETHEQFLNRRNQVLDHILATFGEDLQDKTALLYRNASTVPNATILSLEELLQKQSEQRDNASLQLIREKSVYIEDLPATNRDRAQSYGNPAWRNDNIFRMENSNGGQWIITDGRSTSIFQSTTDSSSSIIALGKATEALSLATAQHNYYVVPVSGGQFRLVLSPGLPASAVAESISTYASNALAMAAIPDLVQAFINMWWRFGLSPLESRLIYMLGLREKERRQLLYPLNEFFEIYDDTPHPNFEKRFRLWELPGFSGDELLNSELNYPGANNSEAVQNAEEAIRSIISRGLFTENYTIENPAPGNFQAVLTLSDSSIIARSASLTTNELAQAEIDRICKHLYYWYSSEGFYMIEHFHLYPDLKIDEIEDPYSFQITFVFPSGYARDFAGTEIRSMQPDVFRDPEYRKHIEWQIRKACPSHLVPRILFVDRALPGSVITPTDPCFDNFEQRFKAWFEIWVVDEVEEAVVVPLKNNLVEILNKIYLDLSA